MGCALTCKEGNSTSSCEVSHTGCRGYDYFAWDRWPEALVHSTPPPGSCALQHTRDHNPYAALPSPGSHDVGSIPDRVHAVERCLPYHIDSLYWRAPVLTQGVMCPGPQAQKSVHLPFCSQSPAHRNALMMNESTP